MASGAILTANAKINNSNLYIDWCKAQIGISQVHVNFSRADWLFNCVVNVSFKALRSLASILCGRLYDFDSFVRSCDRLEGVVFNYMC